MSAILAQARQAAVETANDLRPGMTVRWKAGRYLVGALQGPAVHLAAMDDGGQDALVLVSVLESTPDFAVLNAEGVPQQSVPVPDLSLLDRLDDEQLKEVRRWEKHVREVLTGRPVGSRGSRFTPRPGYDPATTTRTTRYALKAAELQAAGLGGSVATVQRKCLAYERHGLLGLIDKRWLRTGTAYGNVDERVVELIRRENKAQGGKSVGTLSRLYKRVRTALRREYPDEHRDLLPARSTFYDLLGRLGISKESLEAAPRQGGNAGTRPEPPFQPAVVTLLGERVEIDGTGLDVLARGDDGRPVMVELTYAINILDRSLIAGMIVPKSSGRKKGPGSRRRGGRGTKALDAALLLGQAMAPLTSRPGWSPLALAENSDLPYEQMLASDLRMAGAAGRPVIRPKTVVVDNARIFRSQHFQDVCSMLGIEVESARERTPTDKAFIERTNASIKSLFSQFVAGYTGNHLAKRGKHVEQEPLWSLNQLQDMWHEWVVTEWQQRPHEGLRSPFLPGLVLTPNQMYAAAVAAEGSVPRPVTPDESRKLLIHVKRTVTHDGIKIDNRTYVSHRIREFKNRPTGIKGQGRRWSVYYNPYEPGRVWLYDHTAEGDPTRSPWVPFDFKYQHLVRDAWTQYLWERAAALVPDRIGREGSEEEIARAVDSLLARASRGSSPSRSDAPTTVFVPQPLEITEEPVNPYEGITPATPGSVAPAASLNVDAKDLFPGQRTPLPPTQPESGSPPELPGPPPTARRRHAPVEPHSLGGAAGDIFRDLASSAPELPAPRPDQDSNPRET